MLPLPLAAVDVARAAFHASGAPIRDADAAIALLKALHKMLIALPERPIEGRGLDALFLVPSRPLEIGIKARKQRINRLKPTFKLGSAPVSRQTLAGRVAPRI